MSLVRPEFGPTLPALLAPSVRRLPVAGRVTLAVIAAAIVAALAWLALGGADGPAPNATVVREPVAFNLIYGDALRRVAPAAGESLRLRSRPRAAEQLLAVRPLRVAPYRGDVTTALMSLSSGMIDEMRSRIAGFVYRGDGRVSLNKQPGYQISYQARISGRTIYGRRTLLVATPDAPQREGLDFTIQAERSAGVPSLDSLGASGALKTAYRSLRLGTERP